MIVAACLLQHLHPPNSPYNEKLIVLENTTLHFEYILVLRRQISANKTPSQSTALASENKLKEKSPLSGASFIIWHRAIFPGVNPKYCNRYEA
jgi:hypothetical protein